MTNSPQTPKQPATAKTEPVVGLRSEEIRWAVVIDEHRFAMDGRSQVWLSFKKRDAIRFRDELKQELGINDIRVTKVIVLVSE